MNKDWLCIVHYNANNNNNCVNIFRLKAGLKVYIKSLTRESVKFCLWISNVEIFKFPLNFLKCTPDKSFFKFTWNTPLKIKIQAIDNNQFC